MPGRSSGLTRQSQPDAGLADGDQSGDGVHAAGRQLGGGVGGPEHDEADAEPLEVRPRVHALRRPRWWPRRSRSDPATASSSRTVSWPGAPMMLRAAAIVDRASRVVPAPRMSEASKLPSSLLADQQRPGLFRPLAAVNRRGGQGAGLGRLDEPGRPETGGPAAAAGACAVLRRGLQQVLRGPDGEPGQRAGQQEDHGVPRPCRGPGPSGQRRCRRSGRRRPAVLRPPIRAAPRSANAAAETAGPGNGVTRTSALAPVATCPASQPPASIRTAAAHRPRAVRVRPASTSRRGMKSAARASSSTGSPNSRASSSAHGDRPAARGGPAEGAEPGEAAAGVEVQRLAQDLLPQRGGVETERQARVGQQRPRPVQDGEGEGQEQCQAGQERPPHGAAAPAQQHAAQGHDGHGRAAAARAPRR